MRTSSLPIPLQIFAKLEVLDGVACTFSLPWTMHISALIRSHHIECKPQKRFWLKSDYIWFGAAKWSFCGVIRNMYPCASVCRHLYNHQFWSVPVKSFWEIRIMTTRDWLILVETARKAISVAPSSRLDILIVWVWGVMISTLDTAWSNITRYDIRRDKNIQVLLVKLLSHKIVSIWWYRTRTGGLEGVFYHFTRRNWPQDIESAWYRDEMILDCRDTMP